MKKHDYFADILEPGLAKLFTDAWVASGYKSMRECLGLAPAPPAVAPPAAIVFPERPARKIPPLCQTCLQWHEPTDDHPRIYDTAPENPSGPPLPRMGRNKDYRWGK